MSPERPGEPELNREVIHSYAETFISRFDRYPQQNRNGSYYAVHAPLTLNHIEQHLQGHITLGAYALDSNSYAHWVCFDADDETERDGLCALSHDLAEGYIPSYLELSRRGMHLWLFTDSLPGQDARRFARQLISGRGIDTVEIYPKQNMLRTGSGSLVRFPLGIHRKTNHRYHFIDLDGQPLASTIREQVQLLAHPQRIPPAFIASVLAAAPEPKPLPSPPPFEGKYIRIVGNEVSDRIKNRISVYDFVSQFVQLDRGGRGLCPFHDDHQESFSVHQDQNFWHCFAGCEGQTVIDFWMQWRRVDFKQAVKELAAILL
jgi:hypothetical protein